MNLIDKARVRLGVGVDPIDGMPGRYSGQHQAPTEGGNRRKHVSELGILGGLVSLVLLGNSVAAEQPTSVVPVEDNRARAELAVETGITNGFPVRFAIGRVAMPEVDVCVYNPVLQEVDGHAYWLQIGRTTPGDPSSLTAVVGAEIAIATLARASAAPLTWDVDKEAYVAQLDGHQQYTGVGLPGTANCPSELRAPLAR